MPENGPASSVMCTVEAPFCAKCSSTSEVAKERHSFAVHIELSNFKEVKTESLRREIESLMAEATIVRLSCVKETATAHTRKLARASVGLCGVLPAPGGA